MQANTDATTVQYDGHTWNVEAGPNGMGYYRLSRTDTYPHTAHVHGSELRFQPEASEVLAVVDALYTVYLNRKSGADAPYLAYVDTVNALVTLGWDLPRANRVASHVASMHR